MLESGSTPASSRVALVLAAHDPVGVERRRLRKTLFFSSVIGTGASAVGGSIATKARICIRWVTTMSRKAPVFS